METISLDEFYRQITSATADGQNTFLPNGIDREIGHFNVFSVDDLIRRTSEKQVMPYNRRAYYKISLISGRNRAEYADKVIDIEKNALLFATPKVPYHWLPQDTEQTGYFCIFTEAFLPQTPNGLLLDELPIFRPGGYPVFQLSDEEAEELTVLFGKVYREMASDYVYKYDLLRNYVWELIHYGQKLQPAAIRHPAQNASARVSSLFIELLERQFPIESSLQQLRLRTAKDYAGQLAVHVNHLNKVLKETTGKTTTDLIAGRVVQEAKILLKQTDWPVSEIAWCLGFDEVSYFSHFFRKQTSQTPLQFRQ